MLIRTCITLSLSLKGNFGVRINWGKTHQIKSTAIYMKWEIILEHPSNSHAEYLVNDCGQVLCAGEWLEELYAQQGGHGVWQHVLDSARRRGNPKDEHQRKTFNVPTVEYCLITVLLKHTCYHKRSKQWWFVVTCRWVWSPEELLG